MLYILHAVLRIGYYSKDWKTSVITIIHKAGKDTSEVNSYRPISSLLPTISKLFEKLLNAKLLKYLDGKKVISDQQFGFCKNLSTIQQVHRLVSNIRNAIEERKYSSMLFIDISQDKVWHEGLIYKIKRCLPTNTHSLLESYIMDREFRVRRKSYLSSEFPIRDMSSSGKCNGSLLKEKV